MPDRVQSARWWLGLAEGDLAGARVLLSHEACPPRLAAYLAHQAAEKALKAALAASGTDPARTHDLLGLRASATAEVREALPAKALQRLGSVEVVGRYPERDSELIDRPGSAAIVADAAHVVEIIRTVFKVGTQHVLEEADLAEMLGAFGDTVALPLEWQRTFWGGPMPDVVAAVRRSRAGH